MGGMIEIEDVSGRYQRLRGEVQELLDILSAKHSLEAGFKGMGYNIVIEKAGRLKNQIRRVEKLLEQP